MAIKLVGIALRIHIYFGRSVGSKLGKIFYVVFGAKKIISATFLITLTMLLGWFYFLIYVEKFSAEAAVNTAHQLSPLGIFYTIAASIFFFMLFENVKMPARIKNFLSLLGKNSYFVYLAHPFAITYLTLAFGKLNLIMTAPNALIFYVLIVAVTLSAGLLVNRLKKIIFS